MKKRTGGSQFARAISSALVVVLSLCLLTGCERREPEESNSDEEQTAEEQLFSQEEATTGQVSLGDTFTYEGIEVKLAGSYSLVTVTGDYATSHQGQTFIKIPAAVTNVSDERNSFKFTNCYFYDNNGIETDYAGTSINELAQLSDGSFASSDITRIGNMRQGAQVDAFMLLEYTGDGTYYVEFVDNFELVLEVKSNA